jgi:anti-anti-sigma factor
MTDDQSFHVEATEADRLVRARLHGHLDGATLDELLVAVQPLVEAADRVVLDCGDLQFCDSSGLRGFVLLHNALGDRGSLTIEEPSAQLRQILAITGLGALLPEDEVPPG